MSTQPEAQDWPEEAVSDQLGPPPREILEQVLKEHPHDLAAVVVVYELGDGRVGLLSGGCTVVQAVGLLSTASTWAADAVEIDYGAAEKEPPV